nr:hypothetical protein CFP56_67777 [Quercus suber]
MGSLAGVEFVFGHTACQGCDLGWPAVVVEEDVWNGMAEVYEDGCFAEDDDDEEEWSNLVRCVLRKLSPRVNVVSSLRMLIAPRGFKPLR